MIPQGFDAKVNFGRIAKRPRSQADRSLAGSGHGIRHHGGNVGLGFDGANKYRARSGFRVGHPEFRFCPREFPSRSSRTVGRFNGELELFFLDEFGQPFDDINDFRPGIKAF